MASSAAVEKFLHAIETATIPACDAWNEDATLDTTVPNWRLRAEQQPGEPPGCPDSAACRIFAAGFLGCRVISRTQIIWVWARSAGSPRFVWQLSG